MRPLLLSCVLGLTAALANLLGGAIIVRRSWERSYLRYFVALGSGFMLATAMMEMVPASLDLRGKSAGFLVLIGYLIVHLFEHTLSPHLPEGFTIASVMLASGQSRGAAWAASMLLGAATLAGVLVMAISTRSVSAGLPISAGVTIYVAASDLIPEVNKEPGVKMALVVFIGVGFLLALDWLFHMH